MPLPFNKTLDLKLLKLVKENPILYNTKHAKYLDFDSREVIWQKIGDLLSRPAAEFAGIQCQINFGDYQEKKHKPGFIENSSAHLSRRHKHTGELHGHNIKKYNLHEFLPEQYFNARGMEKKILKAYSQHQGLSELEAKFLYIKTARALPTYGVTFFLVKERQKDKKKLVPRLLGINSEAILRVDEVTKEILQQWPLTHVKTYHAGKSQTFTLNFGDYSDKEYCVKTQDCLRIRDILEGYIDIIRRRMLAKPHADPGDSMAICHDSVQAGKSHMIEHVSNNASKIVTETFVGPSRILASDQGSQAHSGATITTVQQIVVTDHLQNQQQALKGEIPVRGDMSQECVRKLNRMNSNSVKIVGLLTDPTDVNVKDAQKIVENMKEDLPVVEKGVKETAEKQALDDAKKMLLDEWQDLDNYMNKLAASIKPGRVNANEAKDAAENIADLTTQIYFSIDPKTRRRSELLRRSRKSFKAGEKEEQTIRRASFIAAAASALHTVDNAIQALNGEYKGDKLDDGQRKKLEKSLQDKMGKLNAAIALYLTAHSDPEAVDYSAAINSMNAIHELMPKLAKEAQMLASTKDPAARKELQDDMRTLFEATRKVCGMTGTDDHEKMQEASNKYADVAVKLIFTFARGTNAEKEDQIIQLAKDAGAKTSLLLMTANDLTCQASTEPAAADVDAAGVRAAGAARDLLACAQLTAPAIHEPHCQSAMSAASEGLASSVHNMEASWKPLLEDPTRQHMSDQLHVRATDVMKALEKLKEAYANLGDVDNESLPLQERQRLKFISTMSGAKVTLQGVDQIWKESEAGSSSEERKVEAQRRLEQKMAQLNAAIAALAVATADRNNPDYATAELAISTIAELMPQIVKDTEVVSSDKDAATRSVMLQNVRALCDATGHICQGDGYQQGQREAASDFAAASRKLVFLISPGADKGKEKRVMEVALAACDKSSELVAQARRLRELVGPDASAEIGACAARTADATSALRSVANVTASSISEPRCQQALSTAVEGLRRAAEDLTTSSHQHSQQGPELQQHSVAIMRTQKELEDNLRKLDYICQLGENGHSDASSAQQEKQRLKFINSVSGAKSRLGAAKEQLNHLKACQMMKEEDAVEMQHQLSQRLAQLNAAVAALTAATADRESPEYAAAEKAMSTISELMPHIVKDSRVLCGTMNEAGVEEVVHDVRALCEACQEICDGAAKPQGMDEAVVKFATASRKLVTLTNPRADVKENEPMVSHMKPEDAAALQDTLSNRLAQLNAAVAALAAATADRKNPDYEAADRAIKTITELMPQVAEDSHVLSGTKDAVGQAAMLQDIRALCAASRELCDAVGQPKDLTDAAAKFSTASGKLAFVISPQAHDAKEQEVMGLSAAACGKTSELLAQVQSLTQQVEQTEPRAAAELDSRGASVADAAQALLTIAQLTASSISEPSCSAELISSAEKLRRSAAEVTTSCGPHFKQRPQLKQQVLGTQQQLNEGLDKLIHACETAHQGNLEHVTPAQQEKQRLKFINSVSGAKSCLDATEQRLSKPMVSHMKPEDAAALQDTLSNRLAQLNAAVAALAAATADRKNPDYEVAERAVKTITELMPQIVEDSHVLSGTKDAAGQAAMLQDIRALCEASRELCDGVGQPKGLADAAAKFSTASGKLAFIISPKDHDAKEQEVMGLSAAACGKTSELLAQVQSLTQQVEQTEPRAAAELDSRGASVADAAQALLTIAKLTAPSISAPSCSAELISSAEKLRRSVAEVMTSCGPHFKQRPQLKQQVLGTHQQLNEGLDKLIHACETAHQGSLEHVTPAQQEKQRLKFINSVSGAKSCLDATEQRLSKPMLSHMKSEDAAALQDTLSNRLAQLNAAVAALAAATADRKNPDYEVADRAVKTITELMPQIAEDSHVLSGTKDAAGQAAMLQDIRALCEASRQLCDGVGQPKGVTDAAAKFSAASGKLAFVISPQAHDAKEKEVMGLSAAACGKTTELLAQVQSLTQQVEQTEPRAAAELDSRGASVADAAQALLIIAKLTAPSISEPSCSAELISSAEKLRRSAAEVMISCGSHFKQRPQLKQQVLGTQQQLNEGLNKLIHACETAQHGNLEHVTPAQQEKQRLKFINSVAGPKSRLDAAEQQMKEPILCQMMKPQDGSALQNQLSRRLAQLNAAIAALATATTDGKTPDYPTAERAVTTITELVPQIVQDSRTLCGNTDKAGQAPMLEQVRSLCESTRAICDSAGQPKKLHEASSKLANASNKLLFLTSPDSTPQKPATGIQGPKPPVPGKKPPVPVQDSKHKIAHAAPASSTRFSQSQDFIDALRSKENQDNSAKMAGNMAKPTSPNLEKQAYEQFSKVIDHVEEQMASAENGLRVLHEAKNILILGEPVSAMEVIHREQRMEDSLAAAGIQVASLVAANYADKLDYKTAMESTKALTASVRSIVEDGGVISGSLYEDSRKPFIDDMIGLCHATENICKAARSDKKVLNEAAISFGNQSAKLLRVVSSEVNPALEKEVISRAKAIGDCASRLALEAGSVVNAAETAEGLVSTGSVGSVGTVGPAGTVRPAGTVGSAGPGAPTHDICAGGTRCADAAGKLVYTAKLVAPTIHHSTSQEALISSADSLSSSLASFSSTWKPLASTQQPSFQKLTEEATRLEELLEKLKRDIRAGKLGKKKEVGQFVNLDMPLRQMSVQIMDNAKNIAEHGEMPSELKQEYSSYSNRLADAIRALDLANARYQRALHDKNKRNEMEIAIQDLQMTALQSRPSRAGQENNYIVDFRDFLQDLAKEAEELKRAAKKNEGAAGKRVTGDLKILCTTISEDAKKLLNPAINRGNGVNVMTSVDDIMDIGQFGQECDVLVKEINSMIQGIHDQKAKQALRAKALPLTESCHLLRFATNSHISATKSAEYEEALRDLDHFKTNVMQPLVSDIMQKKKEKKVVTSGGERARQAGARVARAAMCGAAPALGAAAPAPGAAAPAPGAAAPATAAALCPALALYTASVVADCHDGPDDTTLHHLSNLVNLVQDVTSSGCMELSNFHYDFQITKLRNRSILKELTEVDSKIAARKIKTPVLNAEDIDKLLLCETQKVEGSPKQLEDQVQQLATQLSSLCGTVTQSVAAPASLARGLRAAAAATQRLTLAAAALKPYRKPQQGKKIDDAADEMRLATYSLMKTSELVCQDPTHHDSRRKMLEACNHLNDSINKLVRSVEVGGTVGRACGEAQRTLRARLSGAQHAGAQHAGAKQAEAKHTGPQHAGAAPYAHCLDTLQSHTDILQKLNSDESMSREQFLQSLCYVTSTAVSSADCAAHAAYLLAVSEKDSAVGKEGIVDVPKLRKAVGEVENTCVSIIIGQNEEQMQEEKKVLQTQVQDLLDNLNDAIQKTKKEQLKDMLLVCKKDVTLSSQALYNGIEKKFSKPQIISLATSLMDEAYNVVHLTEHSDLVPTVSDMSADTQAKVEDIVKSSQSLLTHTEELIKQVNSTPDEPEVMKWVMFNKRKDVLDAFEALLKSIKSNGFKAGLLEGSMEDSEGEKKSYVQKQFDTASKWLLKPISKPVVKTNGQQAVRNLIEVANKITEDLKGNDKDDMTQLVEETEQLLTECSMKYDQEQYSVLMERVRELKKGIERAVVTRVVEDFMEAEVPLADFDVLADYEKDETKRKFLLEKKIAELLAHLNRVTKTARLIADTDGDTTSPTTTQLNTCSEQAELLAPMLVKAAQQRLASPDDKVVIENYKSLLARYTESLSKIRDLCDQSVDPMDFVQTAGETMQRMREESAKHNDPMKCALTSTAITKLANRVIHVGMSSSSARADPELVHALQQAKAQLPAPAPPATRASRLPDWRDTTAKILQATEEVESLLGGETIFKKQPETNQPIYNEALNLHCAIRDWSSRDNEIVAVAKRTAVLMAKLSNYMNNDKQHEVIATSKSIVMESHEVARLAKKLAHECTDHRIKVNLLQTCERIPTISGQLKMLTTVKGLSLGQHGTQEDKEAMDMVVGNAQSLMLSIQDVVKGAASASVKIMSQRGPRMKWVRKTIY